MGIQPAVTQMTSAQIKKEFGKEFTDLVAGAVPAKRDKTAKRSGTKDDAVVEGETIKAQETSRMRI
jgi:hypothetical protein